jgi:hypothetical protein
MAILISNFTSSTAHGGLYRIWVPVREGEGTILVAHWIDPKAKMGELHKDDSSGSAEGRETWLGISLLFA